MLDKLTSYLRASWEDLIFFALLAGASALMMFELTSLLVTPIADSYLWWGDESWLMAEFRTQILTGVFRHPYALSSSLAHGSGIVFGNMWLTAALYGIPSAIAKSSDVVMIGRTVTALLSVTLAFVLYEVIRKLTGERLLALFGVLLLITSRSFMLTSHSARYDIFSALAILAGVFWLLQLRRPMSRRTAFLTGLLVAGSLLISVHVSLALGLAAVITVVVRSQAKSRNVLLFLSGIATFALLLFLFSLSQGTSMLGTTSGAFVLNIRDLPGLRIFSRSVQSANILQRWTTATSLALGYVAVVTIALAFVIVRIVRQRGRLNIQPWIWLIAILVVSWLEFESAAPTSYLIYMLPVLSLAIALSLQAVASRAVAHWVVAVLSVALIYFAFHDAWQSRWNGMRLSSANDDAIAAALVEIEQDTSHPLVLAFNPAVHRLMSDTNIRLMTTQFVEFPASNAPIDSVLRREHVRYVLLYRSALKQDYMREVQPIRAAAQRMGTLVWERSSAVLTDIGRSYFAPGFSGNDTLQVYHIRD